MNIVNTITYFIVQAVAGALTFIGVQTPLNPILDVTFTASPVVIQAGETAKLTWSSQGAVECTSVDFNTAHAAVGNKNVSPTKTTTYNLVCFDAKSSTTPQPGTWKLTETDYTDFACPVSTYELNLGNGVTESIPECAGSIPKAACPPNQNGGCTWVNTYNPSGAACTGTGECKVSSASASCVIKTQVYTCTPNTTIGTWKYVGSDLSDIFVFPGGDPSKNNIYKAMADCPVADPEGKQCSSTNRCKINTTQGWLVYTDIYRCDAGSAPTPSNINAVGRQVTITVTPADIGTPSGGGGGGQCSDTIDNDGDGRIDGADFGCQLPGSSKESPNPQCSDGIDNNNNGLTDAADLGACSGPTDNNERFADGSTTLEVPALVQRDETATLTWSVQNVRAGTCTLTGTNGDSWNLSGASGVVTSSKMQNEATFTITCTDLNAQKVTVSKNVKIAPTFRED